MNLSDAWNNFVTTGKIDFYLKFCDIRKSEETNNATVNTGLSDKGNGYKG